MDDETDVLQIKINQAKRGMSPDTLSAIGAVPWQAEIIKMRETKGYTFEQLGTLETETELLLCGLLNPTNYAKELQNRMGIGKVAANELVGDMNSLVFSRIKEELIKITEEKRVKKMEPDRVNSAIKPIIEPKKSEKDRLNDIHALGEHGIEILGDRSQEVKKETLAVPDPMPVTEKLELTGNVPEIFSEKMSGSLKMPKVKTEYTLGNMTRNVQDKYPQKGDPYRLSPDE